jgi:hypothetical protein
VKLARLGPLTTAAHETHYWALTQEPYNHNGDFACTNGFPVLAGSSGRGRTKNIGYKQQDASYPRQCDAMKRGYHCRWGILETGSLIGSLLSILSRNSPKEAESHLIGCLQYCVESGSLARILLRHSIIISPAKENCGLWFVAPVTSTVGDLAPTNLESVQHFRYNIHFICP